MRAAWLEPGGAPYMASLRMDQATTWEQFRDACSYSNIPGENMIWADKSGNIGWQAVGIAPIRKNFSGLVPVPGDGRYEWAGYLPIKEKPHRYNPPEGFIATANNDLTPPGYRTWTRSVRLGGSVSLGAHFRSARLGPEGVDDGHDAFADGLHIANHAFTCTDAVRLAIDRPRH